MTSWIGADTVGLRTLGQVFADHATLLETTVATLNSRMSSIAWYGSDLELFHADWTGRHRLAVTAAATLLRQQQETLNRNADDQDLTSAGESGTIGGGSGAQAGGAGGTGGSGAGQDLSKADKEDLEEDLVSTMSGSLAAQQEWWASLTEAEREHLIAEKPSLLAQLGEGVLSDDERAAVSEVLLDKAAADATVSRTVNEMSIEGKVKLFTFGVAGDVAVAEKADGTFEVTLTGELAVGLEAGDENLSATLTGGLSTTYTFDSQAEADAFLADLTLALVPEGEWDELTNLATGQYVTGEYLQVLGEYADAHDKITGAVALEGEAKVSFGDVEVQINGKAEVEHNFTDGSNTYTLAVEGSAKAGENGGSLGVSAALGADSEGNLTSLTLTGEVGVSHNGELKMPFGDLKHPDQPPGPGNPQIDSMKSGSSTTYSGSASVKVDLENPVNQQLAAEYLQAVGRQDHETAAAIQDQLVQNSQVTLQVGTTSQHDGGLDLDLKALEVKVGASTEDNMVWVKVAGSDEYVLMNGSDRS